MAAANPCATAASVRWIVTSLAPRTSIRLNRASASILRPDPRSRARRAGRSRRARLVSWPPPTAAFLIEPPPGRMPTMRTTLEQMTDRRDPAHHPGAAADLACPNRTENSPCLPDHPLDTGPLLRR